MCSTSIRGCSNALRKTQTAVQNPPAPPSMAAKIPGASISSTIFRFKHMPFLGPKPTSLATQALQISPAVLKFGRKTPNLTVCFVLENEKLSSGIELGLQDSSEKESGEEKISAAARAVEKVARKRSERFTYLIAAVMSSLGITSMAVSAVYCRFSWQMEGGEVPYAEMFGTFALSVGAAVGMEYWARWAHKALWHASLWHMHESHHRPREGAFELNDVFAIINAVPAIALLSYGFFHKGLIPGLCFGAILVTLLSKVYTSPQLEKKETPAELGAAVQGLGITVFGMAYMFVHDGLVHKRFPVGPIANVPYFRKVAAAHQLHHSDKFKGVPYGLFLGPKELEEVGGIKELDKEINRRIKMSKNL